MSDVGSGLPVYRGAWTDQPYLRGDLVLRSGALYQAINNTASQPGGTADISGKGNPAAWVNVTALVLDFTGSTDPTTGSGIPAAISSTYHMAGSGLYVKSDTSATDWESTAGGAAQVVTLLGPFTLTPASSNLIEPSDNGYLVATIAAGTLVRPLLMPKTVWTGSVNPSIYVVLAPSVSAGSSTLISATAVVRGNGAAGGALSEAQQVDASGAESKWGLATVECGVYAQMFSDDSGTPTVGETDVYLVTMTAVL